MKSSISLRKEPIKNEKCNFVFDVVVTHFDAPGLKIPDPKKLQVDIKFNHATVPITSSRINVTEFKTGFGTEFVNEPKNIRKTLEDCGIPVTVKYSGRILGTGRIGLEQMVIDQIEEGMTDLMHAQSIQFEKNGEIIGTVEVLFRLIIKCDDIPMAGNSDCRQNMDKSISPQDIMFVMGETQHCPNPCEPCVDTLMPEENDQRLDLDLQRYRSSSAGAFRAAQSLMHNPVGNAACCQLKKMAKDCEHIVDSITMRTGQPRPLVQPSRRPEDLRGSYSDSGYHNEEQHQGNSKTVACFSYLPARQGEPDDFCDSALMPVPISDKATPMIKPIRFCPVCLTNMSWLPKFAACPKCGVKPMPVIENRHKEKKLTAEQILLEYLGKPKVSIEDYCKDPCAKDLKKEEEQNQCRCTCKYGKLCAHCRIRKLCADIFHAEEAETVCPKVEPKSSEDFCVLDDKLRECRPYLARVFSELRDLYNIKDDKTKSEFDKECGLGSLVKFSQIKIDRKDRKKRKWSAKDANQSINEKAVVKPRIGHKFCVNQIGIVSRRHGWDWSSSPEARKNGWRPGSILKPIKKLMKFFLQYLPEDKAFNYCKLAEQVENDKKCELPTLNVCKKNGEIFITLRPLNNKHVKMNPIQFKLVKSDLAVALRQIKRNLKNKGFRKCTCHKTLLMCTCRNHMEKKHLSCALQHECKRRGMENCVNQLVLTDTSDSEMEFDFDVTPPAGVAKPPCSLKSPTKNHGTQTSKKDHNVPAKYPIKANPYWRAYDCAAGDRYTGTAFGAPGEEVFEDGVFGYRGGGPHGASATPGGRPKNKGIWGASPGGPMRGGGRIGPGGSLGGKAFPGATKKPGAGGKSQPIPVRMPKRFYKAMEEAAKAKEEAHEKEKKNRKKGIDMMKYLSKKGGKGGKTGPVLGPDGLTDAQRRRLALRQMPIPPIDSLARRGKGYDPCVAQCYNPCATQCCYPCGYYC